MSIPIKTTATCQQCGETQPFTLWRTLNATLDPEAKARLLKGELTLFTCQKCGRSENVSYPMLYNDVKAHLLVWLWPSSGGPEPKAVPCAEQMEGDI
jgi:rRNA maturation protein Nop10